jgi:hypothetical protein
MTSKGTAILAIAALGGCATASAEDPRMGGVPSNGGKAMRMTDGSAVWHLRKCPRK